MTTTTTTNAMTEIATWSNAKVSIVNHAALEQHCPELLHSHHERVNRKADNPDLMSVFEHKGILLCTAAAQPIWERNIKCTMANGFTFYVCDHLQHMGGEHFYLSTIFANWIGETGGTYEVIDQEPTWEAATYERVKGLKEGSIIVAEHGHNKRILMVSESAYNLDDIKRNVWYNEEHHEQWTKLSGFQDTNHAFGWLRAHKGQRVRFAQHAGCEVYIYITA